MTEESKSYDVFGVTITPLPGGYYELSHSTLIEPERVRGKEKADTRAGEIAAAVGTLEGRMEPQPELSEVLPLGQESDERVAALEQLVAGQNAKIDQLLDLVATTVQTTGEITNPNPLSVMPRAYRGEASKEQKRLAKAVGVEYVTIVLEDVPEIPPTGLYLGHNGDGYMIMPGEAVDVPDFLLEVLDHAVLSTPIQDSKTQKVLGYRDRMRYPYHRV